MPLWDPIYIKGTGDQALIGRGKEAYMSKLFIYYQNRVAESVPVWNPICIKGTGDQALTG